MFGARLIIALKKREYQRMERERREAAIKADRAERSRALGLLIELGMLEAGVSL